MSDNISHCNCSSGIGDSSDVKEIIVVSPGFIAVCAVAGDVEPFDIGSIRREKTLLHLHRQCQGMAKPHAVPQACSHRIDFIGEPDKFGRVLKLQFVLEITFADPANVANQIQ